MPDGSQRAATYNPILKQLEDLKRVMEKIGKWYQTWCLLRKW